ncbi:hypothetical protein C7T35_01235 [Variovorax sp. WS11]|uniref:hypothetical protein n=1 Tax=Variovorax sp. WS11 TaxID=1105204 RepID=UPI000D0CD23D|nr:hypothetical protein [Variovorax sp. WS11]NDZ11526.1 hypothetical protein [Variovorax sp. WS11]PSL86620.1 hypothetical protein C7T35_01235 [Variovorax sp. WS11]
MSNVLAIQQQQGGALAQSAASGRMAVADIISHVAMVQEVMRAVMKPDVHYGVIPGTDKPTLLKQGAEVLCMAFRVADSYQVEDLSTGEVVRYRVTCTGVHQTSGLVLGTGMGEASSGEEKYKWRKAYKEEFEATPANLRREKKGFNKAKKESYSTFQVRTEPADLANTILKMANKRAKIAMTINVTACGDMFGQDLEDMEETLRDHLTRHGGEGGATDQDAPAAPTYYLQADFDANLAIWKKVIAKGAKPDDVIAKINSANQKTPLSDAQKEVIRGLAQASQAAPAPAPAPAPAAAAVQLSHADVLEKLRAAKDEDALNAALDLANSVTRTDEESAAEEACYDECLAKLRG